MPLLVRAVPNVFSRQEVADPPKEVSSFLSGWPSLFGGGGDGDGDGGESGEPEKVEDPAELAAFVQRGELNVALDDLRFQLQEYFSRSQQQLEQALAELRRALDAQAVAGAGAPEVEELRGSMAQLSASSAHDGTQLSRLSGQVAELQRSDTASGTQLAALRQELTQLRAEVARAAQPANASLVAVAAACATTCPALEALTSLRAELSATKLKLASKAEASKAAPEEHTWLRGEVASLKVQVAQLSTSRSGVFGTGGLFGGAPAASSVASSSAPAERHGSGGHCPALEAALPSLRADFGRLQAQLEEIRSHMLSPLEGAIASLRRDLRHLRAALQPQPPAEGDGVAISVRPSLVPTLSLKQLEQTLAEAEQRLARCITGVGRQLTEMEMSQEDEAVMSYGSEG